MKRIFRIILQTIVLGVAVYIYIEKSLHIVNARWHDLAYAVLGFVIFVTAARLAFSLAVLYYRRRSKYLDPMKDNFILGMRNIYYVVFSIALLLLILTLFGIDYVTLFTSLSIVAAAIAIVTRDFLADVLSGIFLSFSQNMRIDDYMKIGDVKGKIVDMGLQKITFLNDDDDLIFLPNYKVYQSEMINYTQGNQRRMSIDFQIAIQAIDDVEALEADMIENLRDFSQYIENASYTLKIVHLTMDYLDLKFMYTLKEMDRDIYRDIRKRTARRALNFVKAKSSTGLAESEQNLRRKK